MTQQNALEQEEKIIVYVDPEVAGLIPGFLEDRRNDIKAMNEALRQGDLESIRVLGNSMKKGTNGSHGFDTVIEIGKSLEESAKNNNAEDIQKSVQELAAYLDQIEVRARHSCCDQFAAGMPLPQLIFDNRRNIPVDRIQTGYPF